jgi:acyl-coenzyme A synthetase/AMP-(fatty) acid ligase
MHYTYGLSIIQSHLLAGAAIVVTESSIFQKEFWELLKAKQATSFGGVPFTYEMLKKLRFNKMEMPSLKVLTQAGGKLSAELAKEFGEICAQKGIKLFIMYGQTEATARMSYLPWELVQKKAGSIGVAIPKGQLLLVDENGNEITAHETAGELVYKGENVAMGYATELADLAKGDENKGTLLTGDIAKTDSDGFFYIVGRKKRFLKLFGSRVNLDELEQILCSHGIECVCAGADDKMEVYSVGEQDAKIREIITDRLGINPAGYKITAIKEIPRNSSGKILYTELDKAKLS